MPAPVHQQHVAVVVGRAAGPGRRGSRPRRPRTRPPACRRSGIASPGRPGSIRESAWFPSLAVDERPEQVEPDQVGMAARCRRSGADAPRPAAWAATLKSADRQQEVGRGLVGVEPHGRLERARSPRPSRRRSARGRSGSGPARWRGAAAGPRLLAALAGGVAGPGQAVGAAEVIGRGRLGPELGRPVEDLQARRRARPPGRGQRAGRNSPRRPGSSRVGESAGSGLGQGPVLVGRPRIPGVDRQGRRADVAEPRAAARRARARTPPRASWAWSAAGGSPGTAAARRPVALLRLLAACAVLEPPVRRRSSAMPRPASGRSASRGSVLVCRGSPRKLRQLALRLASHRARSALPGARRSSRLPSRQQLDGVPAQLASAATPARARRTPRRRSGRGSRDAQAEQGGGGRPAPGPLDPALQSGVRRARIGSPSRNRSRSSARARGRGVALGGSLSRHFRQIVSRSRGDPGHEPRRGHRLVVDDLAERLHRASRP